MAIAGKVAITLSTENGGAWSSDVTYERLVAVKHNNNLYISRKTVANVEPPNDDFWFLALEGFSGDDIEDIINGTTPVGNAKTLDGHGAEYFAPSADLAKYLPLTGGTLTNHGADSILGLDGNNHSLIAYSTKGNLLGLLGFSEEGKPRFVTKDWNYGYDLLHTGNKPTGTYTGNGSATSRTINTGGMGNALLIYASDYFCIVSRGGAIGKSADAEVWVRDSNECNFRDGVLTLTTTGSALNTDGWTYNYQVL